MDDVLFIAKDCQDKAKAVHSAAAPKKVVSAYGVRRSAALWMMARHVHLQRT